MNVGLFDVKKTAITGKDITKHSSTVKSINTELHRIYGLVNSVDIGFASKQEIMEVKKDLEDVRKKLELYCGIDEIGNVNSKIE